MGGGESVQILAALDHASGMVRTIICIKTGNNSYLDALVKTPVDMDGMIIILVSLHTLCNQAEFLHEHCAHYMVLVKANDTAQLKQLES